MAEAKGNPFDFVNSINEGTKDIIKAGELGENDYVPYIINRQFSYFADTIFYANDMNQNAGIDKLMQYHYLLHSIKKGKRFSKWAKPEKDINIDVIMKYYGYSNEKAAAALRVLSEEQVEEIKRQMDTGGVKKNVGNSKGNKP